MNKCLKISLAAVSALFLMTACSHNPYKGENRAAVTGATIGAVGGGLVGGLVGHSEGAAIGAVLGGAIGGATGHKKDKERQMMERQMQETQLRTYTQDTGVRVERQGEVIRMYAPENVTFDFDRANIKPQFQQVLDYLANSLGQYPDTMLSIEGHTDSVGSAQYNQGLSDRRANSVRNYLMSRGVSPNRMRAIGYGESRPIADNGSASGRAQNRRVEFVIMSDQGYMQNQQQQYYNQQQDPRYMQDQRMYDQRMNDPRMNEQRMYEQRMYEQQNYRRGY